MKKWRQYADIVKEKVNAIAAIMNFSRGDPTGVISFIWGSTFPPDDRELVVR